ncbi:family 15 glycosyltransferase [Phakopsora pachyrhizi]|nr:family 15 glycosyltransferase [Phakopsora pachyrhizi]KAI8450176.1 family 15 glycosyltransferase [Phakopsora pachyrhizi]
MNGEDGLEPSFRVDKKTGLRYPPDVYPARMNPFRRENATFVALVKNDEVHGMMLSMRSVEDRINRKFGYPWVFLNNQRFTNEFKESVRSMTRSKVYFGIIPKGHWSYPDQIDITRARRTREEMESSGVPYGGSESYRHMCRYQSGFFFRHPLMMKFDYYWRVEPQVQFYCDLDYDPFLFMRENKKIYGFIISLYEYNSTVPTLWSSVLKFFESNRDLLTEDENSLGFLVRDRSKGFFESDYNLCHFWSNFEIGDLNFFRSDRYKRFFESLDQTGGFYYERWGDAPIHTIGVLSLSKNLSQIHHFDDIGYFHQPFTHCPDPKGDPLKRLKQQQEELGWGNGKCYCDVEESFDRDSYSCTPLWWKINGSVRPILG